ncbi:MAG: lysine--tRNA ligase [Lentisphaeria bacterium]|nr:lysine--tRNA ligase [Lentisphaeria bacterium]
MSEEQNQSQTEQNPADMFEQRMIKLRDLLDHGENPYGGRVTGMVSTAAAKQAFEAAAEGADVSARLAGRLTAMRVMGKSIFADVKDQVGRMQIYVQKNTLGEEAFDQFKKLDIGDIVTVQGAVFVTRMGEVTLKVEACQLLSKSLRPLPEKWHGLTDVEHRYRQRYLDLISNDEVRDVFRKRVAVIREIRNYLDDLGFMEVETPMLQPIPGGAAARPFETFYNALECPMYMRVAPELYLKRLLVGGFEKVYEINRNFRNEGLSRRHNPEFTMIEIYEAYSDCRGMMDLIEGMITAVAEKAIGKLRLEFGEDGEEINLERPWRRVAYADLVKERMGGDWYDVSTAERAARAKAEGLHVDAQWTDQEITHEVYEKLIERTLIQPTFVTRLPAELVPLAKRCEDDPSVVDVFELEMGGQEIAPGYSELNDPVEQRKRFESQAQRTAGTVEEESGKIDEDFLVAMEHGMPPAGGMGMGIDRLVVLLTEQASIRDVILFPQMRQK